MLLNGADVLEAASRRNRPLGRALKLWMNIVADAEWQSIDDVRRDLASADGVKLGSGMVVTIFNIKGNTYRLLADVDYETQIVDVLEIMTHTEYSKDRWKWRY